MNTALLLIAFLATGAAFAWIVQSGRRAALAERLRAAEADSARLGAELAAEKAARASLAAESTRLAAELAAERAGAEARVAELRSAHERLKGEFAELSASALRVNRDDFLRLAEQSFALLHDKSAGDLATRQQAIDSLVKPLRESLEKVDAKISELEQRRERAYGELGRQLESLSSAQLRMHAETTKLSMALSTTRTAGTWGEVQLRRVVELAGMTEHCDFSEQQVFSDEAGRNRPDLVVSLPGGQRIVVDAKAPTEAYREAAAEGDPDLRLAKLKEHAAKVRGHVEALANRDYWAKIAPSPEFVVLFLPGDSFLAAAVESDPSIMDRAISQKVLLATPMTLVALLKAAAYGWRQEAVSRSAEEVSELGRELYNRIAGFADHLDSAAKGLASAVKGFNSAIGTFEQTLLPGARKFAELGAKGTKELDGPERVEVEVREVTKRR
ncbi:MAG TPA: DNA recombination protein RmuC [Opitutaceae bacterium]|nr:DNA recombination protein RmuC [Opitutaceae bacterium]